MRDTDPCGDDETDSEKLKSAVMDGEADSDCETVHEALTVDDDVDSGDTVDEIDHEALTVDDDVGGSEDAEEEMVFEVLTDEENVGTVVGVSVETTVPVLTYDAVRLGTRVHVGEADGETSGVPLNVTDGVRLSDTLRDRDVECVVEFAPSTDEAQSAIHRIEIITVVSLNDVRRRIMR